MKIEQVSKRIVSIEKVTAKPFMYKMHYVGK